MNLNDGGYPMRDDHIDPDEVINRNIFRIYNRREVLSLLVRRHDGHDLDEMTAREQAELKLRQEHALDGWGGAWSFSGTYRINYDTVRVEFMT